MNNLGRCLPFLCYKNDTVTQNIQAAAEAVAQDIQDAENHDLSPPLYGESQSPSSHSIVQIASRAVLGKLDKEEEEEKSIERQEREEAYESRHQELKALSSHRSKSFNEAEFRKVSYNKRPSLCLPPAAEVPGLVKSEQEQDLENFRRELIHHFTHIISKNIIIEAIQTLIDNGDIVKATSITPYREAFFNIKTFEISRNLNDLCEA